MFKIKLNGEFYIENGRVLYYETIEEAEAKIKQIKSTDAIVVGCRKIKKKYAPMIIYCSVLKRTVRFCSKKSCKFYIDCQPNLRQPYHVYIHT